jgi:hypothetical protein
LQPLLATIVLGVFVGLASPSVDGRARITIALIAIAATATYALLPRFM